jgi:hypothetical protein
MDKAARRAAVAAYKDLPPAWGVYAVRGPDGRVWVGGSRHLETQQNSLWFSLRNGGRYDAGLQAAWREAGPAAFAFEVLERFDPELSDLGRADLLKKRTADWRAELKAETV